jgi:hypothetical protein
MGQYYKPTILGKSTHTTKKIVVKKAFSSYDYNNGAKLMEHSYVGHWLVKEVEHHLANVFDGYPFVWAGDYADDKYNVNVYSKACEQIKKARNKFAKANGFKKAKDKGWFCDWIKDGVYYSDTQVADVIPYEELENVTYKYVINYDKKMFVKIPEKKGLDENGNYQLTIHPLPLLCADGNGRAGGDYSGNNMSLIGSWAYNRIGITNELPTDIKTELVVEFEEYKSNGDNFSYVTHE